MFMEVGPVIDCFMVNGEGERADKFTSCLDGVISCCLKLLTCCLYGFDRLTAGSDMTSRGFVQL